MRKKLKDQSLFEQSNIAKFGDTKLKADHLNLT